MTKSISKYNNENRVIVLARSDNKFNEKDLPKNLIPVAYILLKDKIRKEAKETLKYFNDQDVLIKIISGDNAKTAANIAWAVGVENSEKFINKLNYS